MFAIAIIVVRNFFLLQECRIKNHGKKNLKGLKNISVEHPEVEVPCRLVSLAFDCVSFDYFFWKTCC